MGRKMCGRHYFTLVHESGEQHWWVQCANCGKVEREFHDMLETNTDAYGRCAPARMP